MSFMVFPPEINSGMIYSGPGPGSLMAAATAWDGLAADLTSTASSVHSVISGLTTSWQGPSSAALVSAAAPYATWLENTAVQAGQVGAQAKTAAGLFETAFATTVPPPVIEANRALLLALISTNFFGQNTPAIMATEAHYMEMWAQDGATMDHYMAASQTNTTALHAQQPSPPPPVSKGVGQELASQAPAMSNPAQGLPSQLMQPLAADPPAGTGDPGGLGNMLGGLLGGGDPSGGLGAGNLASEASLATIPARLAYYPAMILMRMLMSLGSMSRAGAPGLAGATSGAGTETLMTSIGQFVDGKLQGAVGTLVGHFTSATNAISAKLGHAASLGALKVPQAWSMATDGMAGMTRAAPVLPHTTVSAPVQSAPAQMMSGMPGGPFGNAMMGALAGRGLGGVAAKAPKIIPRSPAGG